ncbi:hypothetical protein CLIB1423_01S02916 [[Candida] railenensis]|uniref:Bud emergence protein 1 n=1 Tax=[Candida] railenensis TaxID=45579 RepID=A0A9P0QK64_9ASCO|nr:hypothetical protein CLIB1423_01S02916 [[Candida] railenensis]
MSATLFKSKQFKSKKNLKGLLISPPVLANSTSALLQSAPLKQTVVLRAIYDFRAESECELTVSCGDYLKLLDKPGDGWLYVQILEKYDCKGLVPASYVDIEVNDTQNPVTRDWLNEKRSEEVVSQQVSVPSSTNTSNFTTPRTTLTPMLNSSTSPKFFQESSGQNSQPSQNTQTTQQQQQSHFQNYNLTSSPMGTKSTSSSTNGSPRKPSGKSQSPVAASSSSVNVDNLKNSLKNKPVPTPLQLNTSAPATVEDDFDFFQKESLIAPSPITSTFKIRTVSITNVLQYDNRFYYRIDFTLENKSKRYIMKTYQDFYNLHINLSILNINEKTLPKLPQPIRKQTKSSLLIRCNELNVYLNKLIKNEFFKTCEELINWLTSNWAANKLEHRMLENMINDDDINQVLLPNSIDMINQGKSKYSTTAPLPPTIHANSASGFELQSPVRANSNVKYSTYMNQMPQRKNSVASSIISGTPGTPRKPFPHSNSSNTLESYSSLIDRYDAAESFTNQSYNNSLSNQVIEQENEKSEETGEEKTQEVVESKKHNSSSSDSDSLFSQSKNTGGPTTPIMESNTSFEENINTSPITPGTPPVNKRNSQQPVQQAEIREIRKESTISPTRVKLNEFVKVKVVLNNQEEDIIVLKVFKRDLHHIDDLKRIVSEKIYKDANLINHYKFELGDITDEYEIMQNLLQNNKVNLMLIRLR